MLELVAPELQANASKNRLAHPVGEDGGPTRRFATAVLVLAVPMAGTKPSSPKAPAIEGFKQAVSI